MTRRVFLRYVLPLMALAAVAITGFAIVRAGTSESATTADATSLPTWARDIAQNVAKANGDAAPTKVQFCLTTPAKAATVMDEASSDTTSQVYAVVMRGDFTMYTEHLPPGVDPPHADWIMLILALKDEGVAGMAAAAGTPNTSALGAMTDAAL